MQNPIVLFLVAIVDWAIGVYSTRTIAKGKLWLSSFIIFFENLLSFWVFFAFVENVNQWDKAIAYSLGASVGTLISLYLTRGMTETQEKPKGGLKWP